MLKKLIVATGLILAASSATQEEGSYLMIWLHGYYGGKAGDTTMDTDSFESSGKAIGEACAESPELGLMTVINQIEAAQ